MPNASMGLDKWRDYFRSANSDIFQIIEHAILVAASDCPYDFKLKRDRIAELLFACKARRCFGCDRIEVAVPSDDGLNKSEEKYKSEVEAGGSKDTKESKANCSSRDDDDDDDDDVYVDVVNDDSDRELVHANDNHYSYGDAEAEALTDEIEEESQLYQEFLRIKKILDNCDEESHSTLFDCLDRLQLMPLSVETLETTGIGISVNSLRKHKSKEIRHRARTLVEDWKVIVDSWQALNSAVAENVTESAKTSAVEGGGEEEEEQGLPSPPLDEGVFLTAPTSMELLQFFDGIDDDFENPQTGEESYNHRENIRKPTLNRTETQKPEQKRIGETMLKKQAPPRPNRPLASVENGLTRPKPQARESGPGRPKPVVKPRANTDLNKEKSGTIQKKPMQPQEKLNRNNDCSVGMKLEAAKRKLQERYQEAENAKKQRTIQVVELHDLPKQSLVPRNQNSRPGNHNRNWARGRR